MPSLPITFACGLYDRMLALQTGEIKPDGIDLNFLVMDNPREMEILNKLWKDGNAPWKLW